ncbi:hypothetical protein V2A60_005767 [Cordyceps javanica]
MDNTIDDDWFGNWAVCDPITEAGLAEAITFDELVDSGKIRLVARIDEDRRGDACTTTEHTIAGDGPVVFSSDIFSMERLQWAEGVMAGDKTDKAEAKIPDETFALFRVNLESHTEGSGTGENNAIQRAHIHVEFADIGQDADHVGAQRPVVVSQAPFSSAEQSSKTTARRPAAHPKGTASSNREWSESYFDVNRSRPVSVLGSTGESSNCNGVKRDMERNAHARECTVRLTAKVDRAEFLGQTEHKCVLRITPKEPNGEKPAMCHFQGKKMWQKLGVKCY